jgi:uncharacterized repeat protein (TIGR03803 family)
MDRSTKGKVTATRRVNPALHSADPGDNIRNIMRIESRRLSLLLLAFCASVASGYAQASFDLIYLFSVSTQPHFPECTLAETSPGVFYGTTSSGVASGSPGALFRVATDGNLTFLHSFDGANEGNLPNGSLVRAVDGNLYGVAQGGGSRQNGTIFKSDLAGNVSVVFSFPGSASGTITPYSLVQASNAALYGAISSSGTTPSVAYRLAPGGPLVTIHIFTGAEGQPVGPLMEASDGNLYGLSSIGIYRLTLSGTLTTIHTLSGDDGTTPMGNLAEASNGRLYGVNAFGGANDFGTLFSVSLSGAFRVEHAFTGGSDGGHPLTGTARANDGNVYGTTGLVPGSIFRITTGGQFTTLYTFQNALIGGNPNFDSPGVLQGSDGKLYGVQTTFGGSVYSLDVGLGPTLPLVTGFTPSSGAPGTTVFIAGSNFLGASSVTFKGVPAEYVLRNSTVIVAVVPAGGTSGPISVATPNGTATSQESFTVN